MSNITIQLARLSDANMIAEMSRDHIETGLGWKYRRDDIAANIRDTETNVITARSDATFAGFAIMRYAGFEAHLILFAVSPTLRRRGIGTALIRWLITTAEVAGAQAIYVELRANNDAARTFYQTLGFKLIEPLPRYYQGQEAGIRMALDLRQPRETNSTTDGKH